MPKKTRPSARRWNFRHPRLIIDNDVYHALESLPVQDVDTLPDAPSNRPVGSGEAHVPKLVERVLNAYFQPSTGPEAQRIYIEQTKQDQAEEKVVRIPRELMTELQQEARRLTQMQSTQTEGPKARWRRVHAKQVARAILVAYLLEQGVTVENTGRAPDG